VDFVVVINESQVLALFVRIGFFHRHSCDKPTTKAAFLEVFADVDEDHPDPRSDTFGTPRASAAAIGARHSQQHSTASDSWVSGLPKSRDCTRPGRPHFVLARVHCEAEGFVVKPLANQCSPLARTAADANAIVTVDESASGSTVRLDRDEMVDVEVFDWLLISCAANPLAISIVGLRRGRSKEYTSLGTAEDIPMLNLSCHRTAGCNFSRRSSCAFAATMIVERLMAIAPTLRTRGTDIA
jgi:hypothetical protein